MTALVLVAYATRYGSTEEVANAIAAALREHGLNVEVRPAREVRSLNSYDVVVLGAALYLGRWHRDAREFLVRHRMALSKLPVAVFALGIYNRNFNPFLSAAEDEQRGSRVQFSRELAKASWLAPTSIAVFSGKIDPAKLHFPFHRTWMRAFRVPVRDARDWTAIHAWADNLPAALHLEVPKANEIA
jgi:menaquinone-dependent protoporphyrinogen oxidase